MEATNPHQNNGERSNRISLLKGDITRVTVDAIVNAANSSLLGGGGVDGAIHRAGGPAILAECQQIRNRQGGCRTGEAVITTAGKLPARYVIHTVGPVWQGGNQQEPILLANCYRNSLELAIRYDLRTIAFPNISTGIYGYPKDEAAQVAIETIRNFLTGNTTLQQVIFVVFDEENYQLYEKLLQNLPVS
ncbi:MAG: O-acetyl-ADP-ribose deacetylase [Bacteroidota bacterium]|nr:O-acetyl-ADP-ribose deacetylase [Bacteroidota bacterium]